jgi:hypothetical protein
MLSIYSIKSGLAVYAVLLSVIGAVQATKKLWTLWRTRHLRHVWGIRNGDKVVVVCSELDDPASRQYVEPREFIYSLKYGDVDAYFETLVTLLRLFPAIRMRVMSAGELESTRLDLSGHIVVIGGPDYNALAARILAWKMTEFDYRSPDLATVSEKHPEEIVLCQKSTGREYCYKDDTRDFGYFERIPNPHSAKSHIVLIGGCHTIGVAGAAKAFSLADFEDGQTSASVLQNAAIIDKRVGRAKSFAVLLEAERIGQTISVPLVRREHITVSRNRLIKGSHEEAHGP